MGLFIALEAEDIEQIIKLLDLYDRLIKAYVLFVNPVLLYNAAAKQILNDKHLTEYYSQFESFKVFQRAVGLGMYAEAHSKSLEDAILCMFDGTPFEFLSANIAYFTEYPYMATFAISNELIKRHNIDFNDPKKLINVILQSFRDPPVTLDTVIINPESLILINPFIYIDAVIINAAIFLRTAYNNAVNAYLAFKLVDRHYLAYGTTKVYATNGKQNYELFSFTQPVNKFLLTILSKKDIYNTVSEQNSEIDEDSISFTFEHEGLFAEKTIYTLPVPPSLSPKWLQHHREPHKQGRQGRKHKHILFADLNGTLKIFNASGELQKTLTISQVPHGDAITDSEGNIIVACDDGSVYSFTRSGETVFTFKTPDYLQACPAATKNGTIIIVDTNGNLYALSTDGSIKWQMKLNTHVYSNLTVDSENNIIIATDRGNLIKLDENGKPLFNVQLQKFGNSSPAVSHYGIIYIADDYGTLYAIDERGSIISKTALPNGQPASTPAIHENHVYIAENSYGIIAYDDSLNKRWECRIDAQYFNTPSIDSEENVIVSTSYPPMIYKTASDGKLIASKIFTTDINYRCTAPAIDHDNNIIIATNYFDRLVCLTPALDEAWASAPNTPGTNPSLI